MTKAVLHIGMNKAGSTAIQYFFHNNASALSSRGLLFPQSGRGSCIKHLSLADALGFGVDPKDGVAPLESRLTIRAALDNEFAKSRANRLFISCETFCRQRSLVPVVDFFRDYEVKVVVYFRRHDHWWASRYAQAVKSVANPPWKEGFESYLKFSRRQRSIYQSYARLADCWADAFGVDNVVVRPYETLQNRPNLVVDVLRAIDGPVEDFEPRTSNTSYNAGVSAEGLKRIDAIQRSDLKWEKKKLEVNRIIEHDGKVGRGLHTSDIISPGLRSLLIEENRADYEYIAKKYLGRGVSQLFHEAPPE